MVQMAQYCNRCGHVLPSDGRFCGSCGAPVASMDNSGLHQVAAATPVSTPATTAWSPASSPVSPATSAPGGAFVPAAGYAGFWVRVIAAFIDSVASVVILVLLLWAPGLNIAASAGFYLIYATLMEGSGRQATFGKMAMGLKVTNLEGGRLGYNKAFVRNLVRIVQVWVPGLELGFLVVAVSQKKQGIHDLIANSLVVRAS